jgi:cobalt-zinc-cadmium resistance protein CzcA
MDVLNRVIDFSLHNRLVVILGVLAAGVAGVLSLRNLDIDAFPDTTPVQVQINTVAPALSPEEVERLITFPVEQAISGLPGLEQVRSISKFGLSQVVVIFEDDTDIYLARQLIGERLATVELSPGITRPKMGPVATGLGEVFHSSLPVRERRSPSYARSTIGSSNRPCGRCRARRKSIAGGATRNSFKFGFTRIALSNMT